MENQRQNPLAGYFRQPAIYLKLPSEGRWWDEGSLDLPQNKEIAVYPMTTKDEVVLRTPDALLSGQGIVDVIQSCCPHIKDAWKMPSVDVDSVLVAIRIATYGDSMNFESTCPHCKEENSHSVSLSTILDSVKCPDYKNLVTTNGLKIKLHPQHYFAVNRANKVSYEEQKLVNILNMPESEIEPEAKAIRLKESMQRLVDLGLGAVVDATEYVELEDGTRVSDIEFLKEFYEKAESSIVKQVQDRFTAYAEEIRVKPLNLVCNGCSKQYPMDLTFDYANFFGNGF